MKEKSTTEIDRAIERAEIERAGKAYADAAQESAARLVSRVVRHAAIVGTVVPAVPTGPFSDGVVRKTRAMPAPSAVDVALRNAARFVRTEGRRLDGAEKGKSRARSDMTDRQARVRDAQNAFANRADVLARFRAECDALRKNCGRKNRSSVRARIHRAEQAAHAGDFETAFGILRAEEVLAK